MLFSSRDYLQVWSRICGTFHSTQNFGIILVCMLSNGKDHFSLIWPEYSGPALVMVLFDQFSHFSTLDQNQCTFPFEKIVVPSTTLLFPACKNNYFTKRAVAQLDWVCATRMYCYTGHVKFQTGIFAEWKAHLNTGLPRTIRAGLGGRLHWPHSKVECCIICWKLAHLVCDMCSYFK